MINLFVTDIDGCLSEPYQAYHLDGFTTLQRYARDAEPPTAASVTPAVSVCSGRSYPYVEAITQALGLTVPVLFESGGGRFDPVEAQITWNPALTDEVEDELTEMRRWLRTECVPGTKMSIDHAKRTQAGIVSPDEDEIREAHPRIRAFVDNHLPDLHTFATDVSVDVVPDGITKRSGLEWLTDHLGVTMSETAYIGDTGSDVAALNAVGTSFAPSNANEEVRDAVDYVMTDAVIEGTLNAYRHCLDQNQA